MTADIFRRADAAHPHRKSFFLPISMALKGAYLIAAVVVSLLPRLASAQSAGQPELVYTDPVGGVYTQGWSAQILGQHRGEGVAVYVVGDGKLGDFFGVISVNCARPGRSEWLASGGYLSPDRVPPEAMHGIRKLACND